VIRAVISDFGGVLTSPLAGSFAAWSEESGVALEDLGRAMAAATERHGANPLFELEKGVLSEPEFMARLEAELPGGQSLEDLSESYFNHLSPNTEMIEFMRALRDRGLRMALLTNNVREWEPRWRAMIPDIDEIFELVVDSAFVGMRKPDPEIYALTLERLDGPGASECVFVDDIELNCTAAAEAGMRAVHFVDTAGAVAGVEAAIKRDADLAL
jgi:epoxide hydrolase-like predicted phosphatase